MVIWLLLASAHGFATPPKRFQPEGRVLKGGLPQEVFEMTNFATGGARTKDTVREIEMNWKAFRSCYANEKLAVQAAKKNSAVFSPQFSNPTKIKGTYSLLCKRLGKPAAAELLMKNPGVLCNSPASLAGCSDREILEAANLVESLDANKPLIKGVAGVVLALVVAASTFRTVSANPTGTISGMDEVAAIKAKRQAAKLKKQPPVGGGQPRSSSTTRPTVASGASGL